MRSLITRARAPLALAALLLAAAGVGGQEGRRPERLQLGVVENLFRDIDQKTVDATTVPFRNYVRGQTGLTGESVNFKTSDEQARAMADGEVHFGVFLGFDFARVREKHPKLTPLVVAVNQEDQLFAHVLVRKDSPVKDFAGLKGKSVAMPDRLKEHARVFVDQMAGKQGGDVKQFFGEVKRPANVEDALDDAVDGLVDAVVVDGVSLDRFKARKAARFARLRELEKSEPFPATVVAYYEGVLDRDTLASLRKALLNADEDSAGRQVLFNWKLSSFEPVPRDYDRQLEDVLKAYPPGR